MINKLNPHTKQGQPAEGGKIGKASPCSGVGIKVVTANIIKLARQDSN